jgi:hypothetical protein
LLEINADTAKKYLVVADVWFVRAGGSIDGKQNYIVALPDHLASQSVVAQTTAAVHLASSAG